MIDKRGSSAPSSNEAPARRPAWLITIDTEGDNLWSMPRDIRTENSRYLPRFQALCEKYELRPTYLVNWEMACCPVFCEFARDVIARNTAEIGMHLHAWNNPPLVPLTDDDYRWQPYLIEYPTHVMREKIRTLTDKLRQTFSTGIVSHRAGRWALDETYVDLLIEHDYQVDCSVTPGVSWRNDQGAPEGRGGADYRAVAPTAFWISRDDVQNSEAAPLLEVPMTIERGPHHMLARAVRHTLRGSSLGRRFAERLFPAAYWFRPNRRNHQNMLKILRQAEERPSDYIEMMLHSSEVMPGGSPYFPDRSAMDRLYDDLEALFSHGAGRFEGLTLAEYRDRFMEFDDAPVVDQLALAANFRGS